MYPTNDLPVRPWPIPIEYPVHEAKESVAISLTAREKEILQWSALGKSSWEIARIICCTEAGVNYHFCNIRRKFGVRSRWIAMLMAKEQGLIESP